MNTEAATCLRLPAWDFRFNCFHHSRVTISSETRFHENYSPLFCRDVLHRVTGILRRRESGRSKSPEASYDNESKGIWEDLFYLYRESIFHRLGCTFNLPVFRPHCCRASQVDVVVTPQELRRSSGVHVAVVAPQVNCGFPRIARCCTRSRNSRFPAVQNFHSAFISWSLSIRAAQSIVNRD